MAGQWEFFKTDLQYHPGKVYGVEMYHPTNSVLSSIAFKQHDGIRLTILTISLRSSLLPEATNAFNEVVHAFPGEYEGVYSQFTMRIYHEKYLEKFKKLLEILAANNPKEDILSVLPQIFKIADKLLHHQLMETDFDFAFPQITPPISTAHINPDRKDNKEMVRYTERIFHQTGKQKQVELAEIILSQVTHFLSLGDNPHQTSADESCTVAHTLMLYCQSQQLIIAILLRLAQYGFNLLYKTRSKQCVFHYSTLELAYREKKFDVLNFISYATTFKIRQPRDPWHQLGVPMREGNNVITFFQTKNNLVFMTKFSPISALKFSELGECLTLFADMYSSPNLLEIMIHDFKPSNFIERIFVNGEELAGLNVYEIFDYISYEFPNHILINHPHELLSQYQGFGITKKINERLPLALKTLYPDQTIVTYYSGLTYGSVKSRTQLLEGPQYQGKDFARFMNAIQRCVYDQNPNLHSEGIHYSIDEYPLEVRNKVASPTEGLDIFQLLALRELQKEIPDLDVAYLLYLTMLSKGPRAPLNKMKSVPKAWIMELENYLVLQKQSKEDSKTFRRQNIDFAKAITPLMEEPIRHQAYNPSHFFPGITQLGKNLLGSKAVTLHSPITSRV